MSRARDPWQQDQLGLLLRQGLGELRAAEPSPLVWDRVAEQIGPPPRLLARLARWIGPPPYMLVHSTPIWGALRGVGLLGVAVVGALALVNMRAGLTATSLGQWPSTPRIGVAAADFGLSEPELEIQPTLGRQPIDLSAPSNDARWHLLAPPRTREPDHGMLRLQPPREAYNRGVWLRPVPEPRFGPVVPPAVHSGRYQ